MEPPSGGAMEMESYGNGNEVMEFTICTVKRVAVVVTVTVATSKWALMTDIHDQY